MDVSSIFSSNPTNITQRMSNQPLKEHIILNSTATEEDFIDLSKILDSLKRNWLTLFGCLIAAVICAVILANVLPPRWQAETTLQIGKIPNSVSHDGSRTTILIEQPSQTAERLKLRELQDKVLTTVGLSTDEKLDPHTNIFKRTLKATLIKNSDFIQIKVAGFSKEEAEKNLGTTANALIAVHNKLFYPSEKRLTTQLQNKVKQISATQAERASLETRLASVGKSISNTQFAPNIVALNLLDSKELELRKLMSERASLEEALAPSQTYPTTVIDAVHVDDTPYFPKLSLFLAAGAFLGLLLGIVIVLWRDRKQLKD